MVSKSLCESSSPILEVRNITKSFGGLVAVDSVSFDIDKAMILGIIGPNGAGKTTLFNIITGFLKPDGGVIMFDGEDITGKAPYHICKKGIGRTFQLVRPVNISVLDDVMIGAFNKTNRYQEALCKALEILEFAGLSEVKNELVRNLTIASQKRVELAKALATDPKLLLLDELIAGLTPAEFSKTVVMLKKIVRDLGVTIIIIEHVIKAVVALCDRVIVLHHGKKIAEGSPRAVAEDERVIEAYLGKEIV